MKKTNLNELRDRAYKCACEHGFHDREYSNEHWLMLIITELSEAVDADRKGRHADKQAYLDTCHHSSTAFEDHVKDTLEDELADVVIRSLDLAGLKDINLELIGPLCKLYSGIVETLMVEAGREEVNPIPEFGYTLCEFITENKIEIEVRVIGIIAMVTCYCDAVGIDLQWHIEQKMKYNETRPRLNGKNY